MHTNWTPQTVMIVGSVINAALLSGALPVALIFGLFGAGAFAPGAALEVRIWMTALLLTPVFLVVGPVSAWIFYTCKQHTVAYILMFAPVVYVAAGILATIGSLLLHKLMKIG